MLAALPCVLAGPAAAQCGFEVCAEPYGSGTTGALGVPDLRNVGAPIAGTPYHVELHRALPGAQGLAIGGLSEAEIPLAAFGGVQLVAPPFLVQPFVVQPDGTSPPLFAFVIDPSLCGLVVVAQAAVVDPSAQGGIALSNGLRVGFGSTQGPLFPSQEFKVGQEPLSIASGDIDGDGQHDLALPSLTFDSLYVLRGLGDGTFDTQLPKAASNGPDAVALGDLDGDGATDAVLGHQHSDDVKVLLNQGAGSLLGLLPFAAGDWVRGLALGDVDADGALDLAAASFESDQAPVFLGQGDGTFGPGLFLPVGDGPTDVEFVDLDLDGALDLVTLDRFADLSSRLGTGTGAFGGLQTSLVGGTFPVGLTVADLDGDLRPDAAVSRGSSPGVVEVLRGQGDGAFASPATNIVGTSPQGMAVADLDGDGDTDLLAANEGSDDVSVLRALGGAFFYPELRVLVGSQPVALAAHDFDGDGLYDFAAANRNGQNASVRIGLGAGLFRVPELLPKGSGAGHTALGDFDADGALDIAAANTLDGDVSVLLAEGYGLFAPEMSYAAGTNLELLESGDLDGDGDVDLCARTGFGAVVLPGGGDGTFAAPAMIAPEPFPEGLALADLDKDGALDVLVARGGAEDRLGLVFGLGGGAFGPIQYTALPGNDPSDIAVADVDVDGWPDVAVCHRLSAHGALFEGQGGGSLAFSALFANGNNAEDVVLGDFDGDQDLDLAIGNQAGVTILIVSGGGFAAPHIYADAFGADSLALADVDGDAALDVVASRSLDVAVLTSNGDGTFANVLHFSGNAGGGGVSVGDLSQDGAPDLATAGDQHVVFLRSSLLK